MKKNVKKVKYCNYECEKQNRRIKITTHVSNNNTNNNKIPYNNTLPAGTAITTPTKISTKPKTKVNKTVIILKSIISAPSTSPPITTATKMLYDQLLNVINKIQSCYHHYYNDLIYRCNIKTLTSNRRYQCKNIKSNIKIKRKSNPKYLININNKKNKTGNNINNNISKSSSKNSINRSYIGVAKVCNCKKTHTAYKENLKISYQINDYLRQFCFYFQKNFNNLSLLIVIFLLALITSTAHSIDTQGKPQSKSISPIQPPLIKPPSPSLPLSIAAIGVISDTGTGTAISLDSRYQISNTLNLRFDENFKSHICDKQVHIKNRHLNGQRHLKLHAKNILTNLKYSSQNTPNTNDQIVKNVSSNYQSNKPQLRHYNHHHHHHHHNSRHHHHHNQNEKQNILNTLGAIPKKKYNFNTAVIRFGNIFKNNNNNTVSNIANQVADEEDSGVARKISELNINKFINHIRLNYHYKQNNKNNHNNSNNNNNSNIINSSNDTLPSNDVKNAGNNEKVEAEEEDDVNDTTNGYVDVDYHYEFDYIDENDYDDDDDDDGEVDDNDKGSDMFNLLPTITTPITTLDASTVNSTILQSITNVDLQLQPSTGQQEPAQYDDHAKLMKLVMDGLGLKKPPNMKNINISQKEYATKYREYLQRVHTRKRRELRKDLNDDESFQRPLQLFSIVSNASLLNQTYDSNNEIGLLREKRYALVSKEEEESDEELNTERDNKKENGKKRQTLEERVKNILFLRKKYQKPRSTKKQRDERKTNIRLMFALVPEILNLSSSDIEEANTRLVLIHSPILAIRNSKNKKTNARKPKKNSCSSSTTENQKTSRHVNVLNIKLYFMQRAGKRILLDTQKIDIQVDLTKPDETHTQWLQFDVTKAVKSALDDKRLEHVVFELQCDNCKRVGARVLNDAYNTAADAQADDPSTEDYQLMPVLNIIGRFEQSQRSMRPHKYESHWNDESSKQESTTQRHYHHQSYNKNRHNRRTNCYKSNQRCCRHSMEVTFKEIKGFEFIIQPKVFDAGYCHGRCPPRYNPAHHHAMLQSLIWKQNHHKAPRPSCAPSKLVELEVLHVDEKDSEKLKISTWSDMKVVECACS